jgi:hypothetical protein
MNSRRSLIALVGVVLAMACGGLAVATHPVTSAQASPPAPYDAARSVLDRAEADAFAREGFRLSLNDLAGGNQLITAEIPIEMRYASTRAAVTCVISGGEPLTESGDTWRRFTVEPAVEDETIYSNQTLIFSTLRRFPEGGGAAILDCSVPESLTVPVPAGAEDTWITTSAPHLTAVRYERVSTQASTI